MDYKILDRIRKVLSLTASPNEHEASLASIRAQELLDKHNLTMKDIEGESSGTFDVHTLKIVKESEAKPNWKNSLFNILSVLFDVVPFYFESGLRGKTREACYVIGIQSDTQIFAYVFDYLSKTITNSLKQELIKIKNKEIAVHKLDLQAYKDSFTKGMVDRICERISEQRELRRNNPQSRELTVFKDDRVQRETDKLFKEHEVESKKPPKFKHWENVYQKGRRAGDEVAINESIEKERKLMLESD